MFKAVLEMLSLFQNTHKHDSECSLCHGVGTVEYSEHVPCPACEEKQKAEEARKQGDLFKFVEGQS